MRRALALGSLVVIGACSEADAQKCATKPIAELVTASEAAFKRFNNNKEFTSPLAELTPRASGFSYQANIPIWVGTLEVIDKTGTVVASLIPQVHCNGGVEFSIEWRRRADGSIESGLGGS